MARLPRNCLPDIPQHIIQRGNNRQVCFAADEDFSFYASLLAEYSQEFDVAIHAWVLIENYLLTCMRYIELNPVRAGMVAAPEAYPWSSYHANGLGKDIQLWSPHDIYQRLGKSKKTRTRAYRELFKYHLDSSDLTHVRNAVNQGMALGNERFRQEVEKLSGRRVNVLRRGPRPKYG